MDGGDRLFSSIQGHGTNQMRNLIESNLILAQDK